MALSHPWQDTGASPPSLADRERRRQAFRAARRHSRLVRLLKVLLPAAGLVTVAALAFITRLGLPVDLDLTAARMSVTPNSIIMEDPKLTGFDRDGRGYSLSADRAVQALARPDEVRLEEIEAKMTVTGRGTATLTAEAGDYDNRQSTLKLYGGIAVDSSDGYSVRMTDAEIDFGGGTVASSNPVTVQYEESQTTGNSLSVAGGGQVIVVEGGVRTTLMPPKRRGEPPPFGTARQEQGR